MQKLNMTCTMLLLASLSSVARSAESTLGGHSLSSDCTGKVFVEKKALNGFQSIAVSSYMAGGKYSFFVAPLAGQYATSNCRVDMKLEVPANHRVGIYDPSTNWPGGPHKYLGRVGWADELADSNATANMKVSWDLVDAANIAPQSISISRVGPKNGVAHGMDIFAILPHQWSSCKATPQTVGMTIIVDLEARASRVAAKSMFRALSLRLTTEPCTPVGGTPSPKK